VIGTADRLRRHLVGNDETTILLVISPTINEHARAVAQKLGIKVYSYADEASPVVLDGV
jgi:hypothetical protein